MAVFFFFENMHYDFKTVFSPMWMWAVEAHLIVTLFVGHMFIKHGCIVQVDKSMIARRKFNVDTILPTN